MEEVSQEVSEVLECRAGELLDRHFALAKEWFPHQLVPWGEGVTMGADGGGAVNTAISEAAKSALWVGLLTEDNLPHYFHAVAGAFNPDSAMGAWSRRWAAEEQRHSTVIRDWVCVTRALDLVALERARMRLLSAGFAPGRRGRSQADGLVYLTLQELATRVAHRNTAEMLDGGGSAVLRQVAADENLHHLFYRDLVSALLTVSPSQVVMAIDRQVSGFVMPGGDLDGFAIHAARIAAAGVYDFRVHYDQVIVPVVLKHWHLESIGSLDSEASAAREHLLSIVSRLRRIAERIGSTEKSVPSRSGQPV